MSSDRVLVVIGRTRHKMVVAELQEAVKRGRGDLSSCGSIFSPRRSISSDWPRSSKCPWVATAAPGHPTAAGITAPSRNG